MSNKQITNEKELKKFIKATTNYINSKEKSNNRNVTSNSTKKTYSKSKNKNKRTSAKQSSQLQY